MVHKSTTSREGLSVRNAGLIEGSRVITQLPGRQVVRSGGTHGYTNRAGREVEGKNTKRIYRSPVSETGERQGSKLIVVRAVLSSYFGYDRYYDNGRWEGGGEVLKQRLGFNRHAVDEELWQNPSVDRHDLLTIGNRLGPVAVGYRAVFMDSGELITDEILSGPHKAARQHGLPTFFLGAMDRHLQTLEGLSAQVAAGLEDIASLDAISVLANQSGA